MPKEKPPFGGDPGQAELEEILSSGEVSPRVRELVDIHQGRGADVPVGRMTERERAMVEKILHSGGASIFTSLPKEYHPQKNAGFIEVGTDERVDPKNQQAAVVRSMLGLNNYQVEEALRARNVREVIAMVPMERDTFQTVEVQAQGFAGVLLGKKEKKQTRAGKESVRTDEVVRGGSSEPACRFMYATLDSRENQHYRDYSGRFGQILLVDVAMPQSMADELRPFLEQNPRIAREIVERIMIEKMGIPRNAWESGDAATNRHALRPPYDQWDNEGGRVYVMSSVPISTIDDARIRAPYPDRSRATEPEVAPPAPKRSSAPPPASARVAEVLPPDARGPESARNITPGRQPERKRSTGPDVSPRVPPQPRTLEEELGFLQKEEEDWKRTGRNTERFFEERDMPMPESLKSSLEAILSAFSNARQALERGDSKGAVRELRSAARDHSRNFFKEFHEIKVRMRPEPQPPRPMDAPPAAPETPGRRSAGFESPAAVTPAPESPRPRDFYTEDERRIESLSTQLEELRRRRSLASGRLAQALGEFRPDSLSRDMQDVFSEIDRGLFDAESVLKRKDVQAAQRAVNRLGLLMDQFEQGTRRVAEAEEGTRAEKERQHEERFAPDAVREMLLDTLSPFLREKGIKLGRLEVTGEGAEIRISVGFGHPAGGDFQLTGTLASSGNAVVVREWNLIGGNTMARMFGNPEGQIEPYIGRVGEYVNDHIRSRFGDRGTLRGVRIENGALVARFEKEAARRQVSPAASAPRPAPERRAPKPRPAAERREFDPTDLRTEADLRRVVDRLTDPRFVREHANELPAVGRAIKRYLERNLDEMPPQQARALLGILKTLPSPRNERRT